MGKAKSPASNGPEPEYRVPIPDAPGTQVALSKFDSAQCHYQLRGSSRNPLVVCVHGIGQYSFTWERFVPAAVAEGYRVLTYDLFGRGFSSYPEGNQDGAYFVRQLRQLLRTLGLHKTPMSLLGHSLGGAIATLYAERYPDHVEQLVLLGPAGLIKKPFLLSVVQTKGVGDVLFKAFGKFNNRRGQRADFAHPSRCPDMVEWVETQNEIHLQKNPHVSASILNSLRYFPLTALAPVIKRVGKHDRPVLLIWGEQDNICDYKLHTQWLDLLPQAKLVSIPDTGHGVHLEGLKKVHKAIFKLLDERDDGESDSSDATDDSVEPSTADMESDDETES